MMAIAVALIVSLVVVVVVLLGIIGYAAGGNRR